MAKMRNPDNGQKNIWTLKMAKIENPENAVAPDISKAFVAFILPDGMGLCCVLAILASNCLSWY